MLAYAEEHKNGRGRRRCKGPSAGIAEAAKQGTGTALGEDTEDFSLLLNSL